LKKLKIPEAPASRLGLPVMEKAFFKVEGDPLLELRVRMSPSSVPLLVSPLKEVEMGIGS